MNTDRYRMSPVETKALEASPLEAIYAPTEQIPVITVGNFPALGKLAAMRFLEWVQDHPEGVISLPTGKTPEHFIKWVTRLLATWERPETRAVLEQAGVDPGRKPDMNGLHFVQIDEFYPIDPRQHNSFYYYVNEFYLKAFGLDPRKALLMNCDQIGLEKGQTLESVWPDLRVDLSLRTRQPVSDAERQQKALLHRIDDWCQEYEDRIRELGGIGFFLGGIGPDGHIGFNVAGSDHHSTTRLTATNYETQAAAATDLGGIEVSRHRLVITIGLGTITYNPQCVAVILAAGEAKAGVVADAVQGPQSVLVPASALCALAGARFYVTLGAAKRLQERQVRCCPAGTVSDEIVEQVIVDLALKQSKRVLDVTDQEAQADPKDDCARQAGPAAGGTDTARASAVGGEDRGRQPVADNVRFLHTEPHHDDLMLGYLPHIVRNIRNPHNVHHFATLTSGFTAVSNRYMLRQLEALQRFLGTAEFATLHAENYFDPANEHGRNRDIWQYLDGIAARNEEIREAGAARRLLRNLIAIYDDNDLRDPQSHAGDRALLQDRLSRQEGPRAHPEAQGHVPRMGGRMPVGLFWLAVLQHPPSATGLLHGRHLHADADHRARRAAGAATAGDRAPRRDLRGLRSRGERTGHALQGAAGGQRGDTEYAENAGRRHPRAGLPQRLVPLSSQRSQPLRSRLAEHVLHHGELVPEYVRLAAGRLVPEPRARRAVLRAGPAYPGAAVPDDQDLPGTGMVCRTPQRSVPRYARLVFLREMSVDEFSQTARQLRETAEAV